MIESEHPSDANTIKDHCSEAETVPGSPVGLRTCIEVVDSDSEVEIVKVATVLSPAEEQSRMQHEERYGHYHRVQLEHDRIQGRLARVIEDKNKQTPEERRLRRAFIREQLA